MESYFALKFRLELIESVNIAKNTYPSFYVINLTFLDTQENQTRTEKKNKNDTDANV